MTNLRTPKKQRRKRSWPMWLFVAIALLLNVVIPWFVELFEFNSLSERITAAFLIVGLLVGESCFVVVVAGLMKRTWLGAFLFGLALTVAGYAASMLGFWLMNEFDQDAIAGVALLPLFLLVATCPLFGLRHYFGWRLAKEDEAVPLRQPQRLADIFAVIAIVAAAIVLARVPQVVSESEPTRHWAAVGLTCLFLFATSLIMLPFHVLVAFTRIPTFAKVTWLVFLATASTVICIGVIQCFMPWSYSWSDRLDVVPLLLLFIGAAIGIFYLSLGLMSLSGFRFVRHRKESAASSEQHFALQRLTWWRIGGAIAVTMATSVYLANLERWRVVQDAEHERLRAVAEATGGELQIHSRLPWELTLGLEAADEDLAEFVSCSELEYVTLRKSTITDACLQHIAQITIDDLDISYTSITFNGMITNGMPSVGTVHVEPGRFTQRQVSQLEKRLGIEVSMAEIDEE